jgi:hypothetical protein
MTSCYGLMRAIVTTLAVVASSTIVACGGGGGGGGGGAVKNTEIFLNATRSTVRFTSDQAIPGTTVAAGIAELDRAISQGVALRSSLSRIYNSGDPFGESLVIAFCTGAGQIASESQEAAPPTEADWRLYLIDQIKIFYPASDFSFVVSKVNAFMTAVDLSAINPGLAVRYYQACSSRA